MDIGELIELLPFRILSTYIENDYVLYECETKELYFNFEIEYYFNEGYSRINFNPEMYGDEDLIMCDYRNDLIRYTQDNLLSLLSIDKSDNNFQIEMMIKYIFDEYGEDIYRYNIENNYNDKYNKEYNINIHILLNILEQNNGVFKNIDKWPKNCYAVSCELSKYININGLVPVYGKWFGFISKTSVFSQGISNHGWLEFLIGNKKMVIDPTRWVFEHVTPYIYISEISDDYDRAGQKFQTIMRKNKILNIPEISDSDKIINISFGNKIDDFLFNNILEGKYNYYTNRNLAYIANTPIIKLSPYEREIFDVLIANGFSRLIPLDTKELIFGVIIE